MQTWIFDDSPHLGPIMPKPPTTLTTIAAVLIAGAFLGHADAAGPMADRAAGPMAVIRVATDAELMPPEIGMAYVRGIQMELRAHGYDPGPVDGIVGPRTRAAVAAYQGDAGLAIDGVASKELLDHLKFVLPKVNRFGDPMPGPVLDVQRELAKRRYYLGPHDGIAGPATQSAVRRFRADARLPATGEIDTRLLQQIRDAPAEISVEPSS